MNCPNQPATEPTEAPFPPFQISRGGALRRYTPPDRNQPVHSSPAADGTPPEVTAGTGINTTEPNTRNPNGMTATKGATNKSETPRPNMNWVPKVVEVVPSMGLRGLIEGRNAILGNMIIHRNLEEFTDEEHAEIAKQTTMVTILNPQYQRTSEARCAARRAAAQRETMRKEPNAEDCNGEASQEKSEDDH